MSKKKNKQRNAFLQNVVKLRDTKIIFKIVIILILVFFVFSIFGNVYKLHGDFMIYDSSSPNPEYAKVFNENIYLYNLLFGIESETLAVRYFEPLMLTMFLIQIICLIFMLIKFKGKWSKLSPWKYFITALLIIGATITQTILVAGLKEPFEDILFEMIAIGKYHQSSVVSVTLGTTYVVSVVFGCFASIFSIIIGSIDLYLVKHNENI